MSATVRYRVETPPPRAGELAGPYTAESHWVPCDHAHIAWVCEEMAEDYFNGHDGWDDHWPLVFVLLNEDGSEIGRRLVEMETEPVFYAEHLEDPSPQSRPKETGS